MCLLDSMVLKLRGVIILIFIFFITYNSPESKRPSGLNQGAISNSLPNSNPFLANIFFLVIE